jgi:hypothetical protein
MKIIVRLFLLALLCVVGFWIWCVFFPNPEKVIRDRLTKTARLASFSAGQGNISRVAAIEALGNYFTEEIEIKVDVPNYESHTFNRREELMQAALAARSAISSLKVDFPDMKVDLDAGKMSATVDVTLRADINGEKNAVIQELRVFLRKTDGKWLIYRLDTLRTLH